jgi:hypothetical protein
MNSNPNLIVSGDEPFLASLRAWQPPTVSELAEFGMPQIRLPAIGDCEPHPLNAQICIRGTHGCAKQHQLKN